MKLVAALGVLLVCVGFSRAQNDYGIGIIHRLDVTQDVSLEPGRQHNSLQWLMIGKHEQYPNGRSLLQFENLDTDACGQGKIVWAQMYVYYLYAHKPSWHSNQRTPWRPRPIQVYQVNKPWNESEATATESSNGNPWDKTFLSLSGNDADAGPGALNTVTMRTARPSGFIEFDVTSAVRNWASCSENNGVLLRAANEYVEGRGIRFSSNADSDSSRHAYINVLCEH